MKKAIDSESVDGFFMCRVQLLACPAVLLR